jgi:hypothetical protein
MKRFLLATLFGALLCAASNLEYSIQAILLANSAGDSVADFVMGASKDEKVDTVAVMRLIRGAGRNILFDSGFLRDRWFKQVSRQRLHATRRNCAADWSSIPKRLPTW